MPSHLLPLPRGWTCTVRPSVLHAIALAATALTAAWSRASTSRSSRQSRGAHTDRLRAEIALLQEELAIKDARWARLHARRRPHYGPIQRMAILELRAARGWSLSQTAQRFLVTEDTIASWMRRLGEDALVRLEEPVNRFPDFVAYLVRRLKLLCPTLGKVRIAQMLARAGLHLSATTVERMLKRDPSKGDVAGEVPILITRCVTAKRPNHTWHVDLTTIPTSASFWTPWLPFAKLQRWPFCWWAVLAVDQASRLVVGFALFKHRPSSAQVCGFLGRAIQSARAKPRYIITDKGTEFSSTLFRRWCRRRGIARRYGAVGQHGSIAVIERFIRSMKTECTRRFLVPLRLDAMRKELACYAIWYNQHRPHSALSGRTPAEVYLALPNANEAPRFEPRPRWPRTASCARPRARIQGEPGARLILQMHHLDDRAHLPIVELKAAV